MHKQMNRKSVRLPAYGAALAFAFLAGAGPAIFNIAVDPYAVVSQRERNTRIAEIAEKAHYPLFKLARYRKGTHDTVVLGDSRARSLREKYWHELGLTGVINLAYGGGTIPEIHETFNLVKSDPGVRNIVVGIQLRSFDEDHKGGMNRVPEAVRLIRNPFQYVTNWTVAKTAWKMFEAEHRDAARSLATLANPFATNAHAADMGSPGTVPLSLLLSPEICFGCTLPDVTAPVAYPANGQGPGWIGAWWRNATMDGDLGQTRDYVPYQMLYQPHLSARALPAKIERQIKRAAPSDWQGFDFSDAYWKMLVEMGDWARQSGNRLVFVIPPTIVEMQATIGEHNLGPMNHKLRQLLAQLGDVVDLDFPDELTSNPANFSDAYHFNSTVARQVAGEVAALITPVSAVSGQVMARIAKRRGMVLCPDLATAKPATETPHALLYEGGNCRVWKGRVE